MPKSLQKIQIVQALSKANNMTNKQTELFFDSLCKLVVKETKKRKKITIPGIGIVKLVKTKPRAGRNFKTGEIIRIPAREKIIFLFLKSFKASF